MDNPQTNPLAMGTLLTDGSKKNQRVYTIKKVLGRGGFGITYLAESTIYDGNIPQQVSYTIKEFCLSDICTRNDEGTISVTEGKMGEYDEARKDFLREAERLHQMSHEGIVPVNEVFEANGTVYYVMQYLGETSLKKYVKDLGGQLDENEARRIIAKIANALDYIHQKKVTHLDVKPENVMLVPGRDGHLNPVLIDFGLATHYKSNGSMTSRHGVTGVSDGYSPLEQYAGIEQFAPEADIYALGATFYYMLTGEAPKKAANMSMQILYSTLPEGLMDSTVDALRNAMQKLPEKRTRSISAFLADLDVDMVADGGERYDAGATRRQVTKKAVSSASTTDYKKIGIYAAIALAVVAVAVLLVVLLGGKSKTESSDDERDYAEEDSTEMIDSLAYVESDGTTGATTQHNPNEVDSIAAAAEPAKPQQQAQVQQQEQAPAKEQATSRGTLNLGGATWRGGIVNGKPDGEGTMTFHTSRMIDSNAPQYMAEPGDRVKGTYVNGHLEQGTWLKADGTSEYIYIGS